MATPRAPQLQLGTGTRYSVDTSALRETVDVCSQDVFGRLWKLLGDLADEGRLLVCDQVRDEWDDEVYLAFLSAHAACVVELPVFAEHFAALQARAGELGIGMTKPEDTKDIADPFVVALALWVERRRPDALEQPLPGAPECCVVSHEKKVASPASIPFACAKLRLTHIRMSDLLRLEGYSDAG